MPESQAVDATPPREDASSSSPSSADLATTAPSPANLAARDKLLNQIAKASVVTERPSRQHTEDDSDNATTGVLEPEPEKQWWYKKDGSPMHELFKKIAIMRAAGLDSNAIGERLGKSAKYIRNVEWIARKNRWCDEFTGEPLDTEFEAAMELDRKVVRNISASLDGQMTNWQTHEMTIAAAKGRGIFKNHEKNDTAANTMPVVAIQVVMPAVGAGDQLPHVDESQMGGVPAYVEGDVCDGTAEVSRLGDGRDGGE